MELDHSKLADFATEAKSRLLSFNADLILLLSSPKASQTEQSIAIAHVQLNNSAKTVSGVQEEFLTLHCYYNTSTKND